MGESAAPKRLVPNPRANDGQADEPDFLLVEDREARQERAPGLPDSPAVASVPTQGDSAACGHDPGDISFDRSLCACGAMHYFCNVCGAQADPCRDEEPAPAADVRELEAKVERLKQDYLSLARWAGQQNAGNAFATQVRLYAEARIAEWDLPLEEWEP